MNTENPQSKRKHQRANDQGGSALQPYDKQDRGDKTPRHASDAARSTSRSPSQVESRRHSRGSR